MVHVRVRHSCIRQHPFKAITYEAYSECSVSLCRCVYSVATPCSGSARPTWRLRPALGDGTHTARWECGCVLIMPLCPRRSSRRCTFWHRVALSPKQVFDSIVFSFFRCNSHGYTGCADFRFVSVMFALSCLYASTSSLFFRAVSAFFLPLQRCAARLRR